MFVGYLCDTMTGTVGPRVELLSGSSERVLCGIGTWDATIPGSVAMSVAAKWLYPWRASLLIMHVSANGTEVPWGFGPITSLPQAEQQGPNGDQDMDVTISGHDFRALLARRYLTGPSDVGVSANGRDSLGRLPCQRQSIRWSGCSLGTIARLIVSKSMDRVNGALPIDFSQQKYQSGLPYDDGHTRDYSGWNISNNGVDKLLDELSNCIGGPHIDFRPFYKENGAMYMDTAGVYMVTGTETDNHIPQAKDYTWDLTRPNSPAMVQSWDTSAEEIFTRSFATGEGSEADQKIDFWTNTTMHNRGFPLLEQVNAYSSVKNISTLQSHAQADGQVGMWPTVQVTMDLDPYHADTAPGAWQLGDRVNLRYAPTFSFLDHAQLEYPVTRHTRAMAWERLATIFNMHADFATGQVTVKAEVED